MHFDAVGGLADGADFIRDRRAGIFLAMLKADGRNFELADLLRRDVEHAATHAATHTTHAATHATHAAAHALVLVAAAVAAAAVAAAHLREDRHTDESVR